MKFSVIATCLVATTLAGDDGFFDFDNAKMLYKNDFEAYKELRES